MRVPARGDAIRRGGYTVPTYPGDARPSSASPVWGQSKVVSDQGEACSRRHHTDVFFHGDALPCVGYTVSTSPVDASPSSASLLWGQSKVASHQGTAHTRRRYTTWRAHLWEQSKAASNQGRQFSQVDTMRAFLSPRRYTTRRVYGFNIH